MVKYIESFISDYLSRHKNGLNKLLHIIGIPLALFGLFRIFAKRPAAGFLSFFNGYLLQWIGHAYFEKNEVGEWIIIKKIYLKIKGRLR